MGISSQAWNHHGILPSESTDLKHDPFSILAAIDGEQATLPCFQLMDQRAHLNEYALQHISVQMRTLVQYGTFYVQSAMIVSPRKFSRAFPSFTMEEGECLCSRVAC
jgi:hypothetical protein